MMRHVFLTRPDVISPRWLQAFPDAEIIFNDAQIYADANTLVWVVINDSSSLQKIPDWISCGARVIAMSLADNPQEAKQIVEAGSSGYLHYLTVTPMLEQVAQVVQLGGLWLGADLMRHLVIATAAILKPAHSSINLEVLTAREKDVTIAVAAGKSNKEVARELDITERTVKAHLSVVFEKLQVRDRLQLVLMMSGK